MSDDSSQNEAVYLASLTIQDVRCFKEEPQTINFCRPDGRPAQWTVLLGNNGTGKTTVLQLVAMFAEQAELARLLHGQLYDDVFNDHVLQKKIIASKFFKSGMVKVDYTVLPLGDRESVLRKTPEENADGRRPYLVAYGVTRRSRRILMPEWQDQFPWSTLFDPDLPLINAEAWLLQLDYAAVRENGSDFHRRRFDAVTQLLIDLLPDVDDIRLVSPSKSEKLPKVEFLTPYGWVPLVETAYGYQTLFVWVIDLASKLFDIDPDSEQPLHQPAVVLVDEIDLHLHPSWQRQVMRFLSERFPNVQFIVTAHSPLIVQAAPEVGANVVLLRREGDHVVVDNDAGAIRGWRVDQVLASDLYDNTPPRAPETQELLDERRKLLAKGKLTKADRQRIDELEQELGYLPAGESTEEIRTSELLRKTLDALQTKGSKN